MSLTLRSPEIIEKLIELVANGVTISRASTALGISTRSLAEWRAADSALDERIAKACYVGIDVRVDSAYDVIDTEQDVNRARLKVDFIKWEASKRMPSTYGDRIDVNVNKTVDIKGALSEARKRAMLPGSNQENVIDAEIVEPISIPHKNATEYESVDRDNPQQNQTPLDFDAEDILK
jgi:hypothetical protein